MAGLLISSQIGTIRAGGSNTYFELLKGLVKSAENEILYKAIKNGKGKTYKDPIKAYTDLGGAAIGFGTHYIPEGSWANVNNSIRVGKATVDIKWVITGGTRAGVYHTSLEQVSMISNKILMDYAWGLYTKINNNYPAWLQTLTDHEFCAMLDMAYNMAAGTGWVTDKSGFGILIAAIAAHQLTKAQNKDKATIDTACHNVVKEFLRYCNPGSEYEAGLIKRRKKDGEMYVGSTAYAYDETTPGDGKDILKAYGVNSASLITVSLSIDNSIRIKEAVDARNAMGGSKYASQLDDAIVNGDSAAADKILDEIKKEDFYKQENTKARSAKGVGISDVQINAEDSYEPHYISDGKAYSGMLLSERDSSGTYTLGDPDDKDGYKSAGTVSTSFELGRIRKNLNTAYGSFRKYKQTTEEDVSGLSTAWFFMTRPEMCLYQNSTDKASSDANWSVPSYQCMDADMLDHLFMDRDLYMYLDKHIKPYYADTNLAFIPAFTNNFKSSNLPEVKFDMSKSAATTLGVSLGIPVYNSTDTADTEISVQFNPDSRKSIMKYIDMIFKYSKSKKEGITLPYPKIAKHNVIDISTTIFMFVVGPDGMTLESYYRSVGVVPSSNPVTSLPLTGAGERMDVINVNFKCNTNLDSRKITIIEHFNLLNRMGCSKVKHHSSDSTKTFEKLNGKIKTYDDAIDWYLMNRHVLDIYMDENMRVGDWSTERFIIYADPSNGRAEYKMVAIPKSDRLYELMKFVLESPGSATFNSLIGRDTTDEFHFRGNINALYKKYRLNAEKIEELLRAGDLEDASKSNLDYQFRLNDSMTRMMNKVSRSVYDSMYMNPAANTFIVTGERVFGRTPDNSPLTKNSGEWVMKMFRETPLDYQIANSRMRPPITTIFTSEDDKDAEVGPGFGELGRLLTHSKVRSNDKLHYGGTKNAGSKQIAAFASVHGGVLEYLPFSVDVNKPNLSKNHKDYIKKITDGDSRNVAVIDKTFRMDGTNQVNSWNLEVWDVNDGSSFADTSLKPVSSISEQYKLLVPTMTNSYKNPLQDGTSNSLFSESGILTLGDPVGMTAMQAYEQKVDAAFTDITVTGMDARRHHVNADSFIYVVDSDKKYPGLVRNSIVYGLDTTSDRSFLKLISTIGFGEGNNKINFNSLDSNNLVRAYWTMTNSKEWKSVMNNTDAKTGKTTYSDDLDKKKEIFYKSPVDMTFELTKDGDMANYSILKPIPGRHQPFIENMDDKLFVFRTKAKIRYIDNKNNKILKTEDTSTKMLLDIFGYYPNEYTFKDAYSLDEDGTLDQAGHQVISLFDKSVMVPSIKYEHVKSFLLNPSLSSNARGVMKSTEAVKFVSFERFGETRQLHMNAMDGYFMTPVNGNPQSTWSRDGMEFQQPRVLDLPQNAFIKDRAMNRGMTASITKSYGLPMWGELLPDFLDGVEMTAETGYDKLYFSHFLANGIQVNPTSIKRTKIPFLGSVNWENMAQHLWMDMKGIALQYLLNKADDIISDVGRKLTYNPLKFGDGSPVNVKEVEYDSSLDVSSVMVEDVLSTPAETITSVHVPNIDLSEDKAVMNVNVADVVGSYEDVSIKGEELSSITSFIDTVITIEEPEFNVNKTEDTSIVFQTDELYNYNKAHSLEKDDVSSVNQTDELYNYNKAHSLEKDDIASLSEDRELYQYNKSHSLEKDDVHSILDDRDLYQYNKSHSLEKDDVSRIIEDKDLYQYNKAHSLEKDDVSVLIENKELYHYDLAYDPGKDDIKSWLMTDIIPAKDTEDVSVLDIEIVKGIKYKPTILDAVEVKGTTDSQEYTLEEVLPTYSYIDLPMESMKVPDIPVIVEDSSSIASLLNIDIVVKSENNTSLQSKVNKGEEVIKSTIRDTDSGKFDFYGILNTIIDFDSTKVE